VLLVKLVKSYSHAPGVYDVQLPLLVKTNPSGARILINGEAARVTGTDRKAVTPAVLDVPPENTFYVFAPASLGLIVALVLAPILIKIFKERLIAALGFLLVAIGMVALGMIGTTTDALADTVLIFDIPGVEEQVEMAAAISLLLGTGMTLAAAATMTYIGKYVPSEVHGRMFALLGAMKDGMSIPVLLMMGAVAGYVGVDKVLLVSPLVLLGIAFGIDAYIGRWRTPEHVEGPVIDRI
jgi:MFS family permease